MESMNDEEDADIINCEEDQDQPHVRVASLEKLVDYCAEEFSRDVSEPHFLSNSVFMTHKWFISSEELLRKFMQRYSNHSASNNEHIRKFKRSICRAVGFWISSYGSDFKKDETLTQLLSEFHNIVEGEEEKDIIHPSNICAEERNRTLSAVTSTEHTPMDQRKSSLAFKDISANTIAEQLTYLEYKMLRRIPFSEWKTYVCTGKLKETAYLERYVALFNGVSRWVQGMVLNCVSPQERASCMEKFQQTAKHLKELQNFNGLMAVAGGLRNTALTRLRQTQELLTQECQEYLKLLMEFLTSNGNYASYRKTLNNCDGFHIPILGIQLKDLIALHIVLPDTVDGHLLNVQKMVRLSSIMLRLLQTTPPPVQPNLELIKMLRVSLQPRLTDEELYELSLAREPRIHSHSSCASLGSVESSGEQSVMFADWAAGLLNTTPDPVTTERHVSSMVEAVFRIYDTNKDGSISVEEFDAIATNFPFIDSFGVLDVNSDGVISREEMKNYFMKANCRELSQGFSHTFQETTYFTPTFCDHCAGMLWGIIKQGYRCKNCHINCHKNCKGEIVRGCRQKSSTQLNGSAVEKPLHKMDTLRINKWKNKMKLHKHLSEESLKSLNGECVSVPIDQYKQLLRAQQANEAILEENVRLHRELQNTTHKLNLLQNHLNSLRQNTVTFILDQMDALQMQKDTEV
ncbi:ras guanyl-releasing protein 3-like isoform X2 [Oculina patagonica]